MAYQATPAIRLAGIRTPNGPWRIIVTALSSWHPNHEACRQRLSPCVVGVRRKVSLFTLDKSSRNCLAHARVVLSTHHARYAGKWRHCDSRHALSLSLSQSYSLLSLCVALLASCWHELLSRLGALKQASFIFYMYVFSGFP